jgi:hypothetical protein
MGKIHGNKTQNSYYSVKDNDPCKGYRVEINKDNNIRINVTMRLVRVKHCCRGKAISVWLYSCLIYPACEAHALYYTVISGLSEPTAF